MKYIGVKIVDSEPMTVREFSEQIRPLQYSGEDQNGYKVTYEDGYVSWSPKSVHEKAYRPITGLTFGLAVEALKKGHRVARAGWNGKEMWLSVVTSDNYLILTPPYKDVNSGPDSVGPLPWIGMKTADNKFVPWLASQTDMLAEDWMIVE